MIRLRLSLWLFLLMPAPALAADVQEITTPSGIRAWLVEDHSLPLLAVQLRFTESGSAHDPKGKEGRANMASALLGEGAGELDARAFSEAIEARAMRLTFSVDEDGLDVALESLSEHKDEAMRLLGLALAAPRMDESSIGRVRAQTLSLITQMESRPAFLAQRALRKAAFGEHPYAVPATGTAESVRSLTQADVRDYAKTRLTRGNMVVAIAGDISAAEATALLERHLAALPAQPGAVAQLPEASPPAKASEHHLTFDVPQTVVAFGLPGIKRRDPDFLTAFIVNHMLGGGGSLTSRLGREIREKRGFTYGIATNLDPLEHGALWHGSFATRAQQAKEAVAAARSVVQTFAAQGFSDVEFEEAKDYLRGSFMLQLDSNADLARFLITMQVQQLGIDYLDKRNQLISAITREEAMRVAKRLLDSPLMVVTVGQATP
jgi:zinc protease